MSRMGRLPIAIPAGVDVKLNGQQVEVKGPKGSLTHTVAEPIKIGRNDAGELEEGHRAGRGGLRVGVVVGDQPVGGFVEGGDAVTQGLGDGLEAVHAQAARRPAGEGKHQRHAQQQGQGQALGALQGGGLVRHAGRLAVAARRATWAQQMLSKQ